MCDKCGKRRESNLIAIEFPPGSRKFKRLCLKCAVLSGRYCSIHGEHLLPGQVCHKCATLNLKHICKICGESLGKAKLSLSIPCKFSLSQNPKSCLVCAKEYGYYCDIHSRYHIVFEDGVHYCPNCHDTLFKD